MIPELSPTEAQALLETDATVALIDCREEAEYAICHLSGAQLVPLSIFAGEAPKALADRDQPIVIYCHGGVRSARAAAYLLGLGYTRVWNLRGGIDAWSVEVDPSIPRY